MTPLLLLAATLIFPALVLAEDHTHEWLPSEYILIVAGETKDIKADQLEQCANCGMLKAPIKVKEELPRAWDEPTPSQTPEEIPESGVIE